MAIFTINKEAPDYSVDNSSIVTDCSSSYFYDVGANQGNSIDVVLSGNHQGAYYTLNGVKTLFTDTASAIIFNNSLVIGFFLKNSGDAGEFHTCLVEITNNNSISTNPTFSYQETRLNDSVDCDAAILTVDNGAQDNHVAVFTGPNGLEGTDNLTYDGTTLDVTGQVLATSIAIDGGLGTQYLMADGSVSLGTGGAGGDLSYEHDQPSASATWSVTHNLGKFPSVTIVDTATTTIVGNVNHTNVNSLTITFNASFAGYAYMN